MSQLERCSICLQPPQKSVLQTGCHHIFCAKCICRSLLECSASIYCPNCRTILKSLKEIDSNINMKLVQRFNFKFKRVKFKVFVDMNKFKTFGNYLSDLLDINVLRLKIIYAGKQCDEEMIMENINNDRNNLMEYTVIGSKEEVYTLSTRIKTEYLIRINQAQYQWIFIQSYIMQYFQSIIHSITNITFTLIIQYIMFIITFLLQLIVLYFRSLCNPQI